MKHISICFVIILANLGAVFPLHAQYAYQPKYQTGAISRTKTHLYQAFTNACPPLVRYYVQQTYTESKELKDTNEPDYYGQFNYKTLCLYDSNMVATNGSPMWTMQTNVSGTCSFGNTEWAATGSVTLSNGWTVVDNDYISGLSTNNYPSLECDAVTFDWGTPYCLGLLCGPDCNNWASASLTSSITESTMNQNYVLSTGEVSSIPSKYGNANNNWELANEYTTMDLLQGFPLQTNWLQGSSPGAYLSMLTSDQANVTMQGSRVKILLTAPKNELFSIPYVLHVEQDGFGTNVIPGIVVAPTNYYTTNYIIGRGYGVPYNYPSGKGIFLCPPLGKVNNGCVDLYYGGSLDMTIQGYICIDDGADHLCNLSLMPCPACSAANAGAGNAGLSGSGENMSPQKLPAGMPQWSVSEPYINLWVSDKPCEYTTSLGEQIDFTITYKQRDTRPAYINGSVPHLRPDGWNNSWYSYVHFNGLTLTNANGSFNGYSYTNWTATVYEPNGGETSYTADQGPDVTSVDQLLPMDGVDGDIGTQGFRLVHSDGSQDLYGLVTMTYATNYVDWVPIMQDMTDRSLTLTYTPGDITYAGDDYEEVTPQLVGNCTSLTFGTFNHPATNSFIQLPGWTNVVQSVTNLEPVLMCVGPSADALLSEHIDPQGNARYYNYAYTNGGYQLATMVDYDGQTTIITYDTNGYIASVNMPYGHTATFQYAADTNAHLLSVTDAQGMTSTFGYRGGYLSGMTTPYGSTVFVHYEKDQNNATKNQVGLARAIQIINPDNSGQIYAFYASDTNGAPYSYPTDQLPGPGQDNGDPSVSQSAMYLRNSYYWGPKQYEQLSLTNPSSLDQLSAADFLLGRMTHWKMEMDGVTVSGAVSLTQDPSPDGRTPGQKTWYGGGWQASDNRPTTMKRLLPDETVWTENINWDGVYSLPGLLSSISTSYTDQYGNLSAQSYNYSYQRVTYSESFVNGETSTWVAAWPYEISGPGYDTQVNNQPDQIVFTDNRLNGPVTGTYPHYAEMLISHNAVQATNYLNDRGQLTGMLTETGLTVTNIYDNNGFLSKSIALDIQATNTFTFANGLPATRRDPNSLLTSYTWDNLDRLTGIYYPDGTSLINSYTRLDLTDQQDRLRNWTHAQYDSMRRKTSFTDRNGNITKYDYCSCGGLNSITDPQNSTTTYARNLVGWINSIAWADANGNQTTRTFTRDSLGRATNIVDSSGLNLNYAYNIQGLVTNISSVQGTVFAATYDYGNQPLTVCNAEGLWVTNQYDWTERLTDQYFSQNLSKHYGYSGVHLAYTSTGSQNWDYISYGYDNAGRLISTTDANNYYTNGFAYSPAGQLVAMADGNGHVTQWAYDIYSRQIRKTDGNGVLVETNRYDADGRVTAHWTPAGGLTYYSYDANGNPLAVTYSSGTSITAAYDSLNRITSMSDAVGSSTFTYQNFGAFQGALATEDGPWVNDSVLHSYSNRLLQEMSLLQPGPSPWNETYGYDSLQRLTSINSTTAGTFGYTYNGAGRQIQILSLPSGNNIAETYDGSGNLMSTALRNGSTVLDSYGYAYDSNGSRTNVLRMNGSQVAYGYDNLGQLTSATGFDPDGSLRGNENFGYLYDPANNLLVRTNNTLVQAFTTDRANELVNVSLENNLLTVVGSLTNHPSSLKINGQNATIYNDLTFAVTNGVAVQSGLNVFTAVVSSGQLMTNSLREVLPASVNLRYDLNGNLVWDGMKGYGYDCANELTSITVTDAWQTKLVYDGFGRRRVKQEYTWSGNGWTKTNEVHYVYDGMTVIQERDANNNPLVSYTRGLDLSGTLQGAGGIGGLLARKDANGITFYHSDGNGNVTMLINSAGTMQAKYLYDSFGNPLGMWGPLAQANTYRFSSMETYDKAGVDLFAYRAYIPNLHRWLNRDPLGDDGSLAIMTAGLLTKPGSGKAKALSDDEAFSLWSAINRNLYNFVDNNPVNEVDPLGLDPNTELAVAIARGDTEAIQSILDAVADDDVSAAMRKSAQDALNKLRSKAGDWISKQCKGGINREFPDQFRNDTLEDIKNAAKAGDKAAKKAWKLLNDSRFKK